MVAGLGWLIVRGADDQAKCGLSLGSGNPESGNYPETDRIPSGRRTRCTSRSLDVRPATTLASVRSNTGQLIARTAITLRRYHGVTCTYIIS